MSSWDKRGIGLAEHIATWSKDPSTKVGAVILNSNNTLAGVGFNGFPRGVKDTSLECREYKYPRVVHAELNAILNSPAGGTTLYCTMYPCSTCAGPIIQYGIKRIVTRPINIERWSESQQIARTMFEERGITVHVVSV